MHLCMAMGHLLAYFDWFLQRRYRYTDRVFVSFDQILWEGILLFIPPARSLRDVDTALWQAWHDRTLFYIFLTVVITKTVHTS